MSEAHQHPQQPPQPSRYTSPEPPYDHRHPEEYRLRGTAEQMEALALKLEELANNIGHTLDPDTLAVLNACVTEAKAMCPAEKAW